MKESHLVDEKEDTATHRYPNYSCAIQVQITRDWIMQRPCALSVGREIRKIQLCTIIGYNAQFATTWDKPGQYTGFIQKFEGTDSTIIAGNSNTPELTSDHICLVLEWIFRCGINANEFTTNVVNDF